MFDGDHIAFARVACPDLLRRRGATVSFQWFRVVSDATFAIRDTHPATLQSWARQTDT